MLKDHRDLLLAFNEFHVRYLLIGGYALGRYTEPPVRGDLDVFVDASPDNSTRVFNALARFGAPLAGYTAADFETIYETFQIGTPPTQIELIFAISGLSFEEAWKNSVAGTTSDGIHVRYLSSEDFIRNKRPPAVCRILRTSRPSLQQGRQMVIRLPPRATILPCHPHSHLVSTPSAYFYASPSSS
jgi:hypothetical protein